MIGSTSRRNLLLLHLGEIRPTVNVDVADVGRIGRLNLRKAIAPVDRRPCTHAGPILILLRHPSATLVREKSILEPVSIATVIKVQLLIEAGAHRVRMICGGVVRLGLARM